MKGRTSRRPTTVPRHVGIDQRGVEPSRADPPPSSRADTSAQAEEELRPRSDQDWPAVEEHPVLLATAVEAIPAGLVMVAGDASATPTSPQDAGIVRWHCQSWASDDATNPRFSPTIPDCVAPDRVQLDIFFPSCWDGVNLDSDDHASHLAYPVTEQRDRTSCR